MKVKKNVVGRVCYLHFKSNDRRLFFWMQETKAEKDEEICKKVNELINNPPQPGSGLSSTKSDGPTGRDSSGQLQDIINNISQQQLMQILNSGVPQDISSVLSGAGSDSSSGNSSSSSCRS